MTTNQIDSLDRARNGTAMSNYPVIFAGFKAKGISEEDIKPRVNIFTYNAWEAQGKHVKRGEHGVHITTFIHGKRKEKDGTETDFSFPKGSVVFHVSQVR